MIAVVVLAIVVTKKGRMLMKDLIIMIEKKSDDIKDIRFKIV